MSNSSFGHITVAAYTHPELYPPVLAAVEQLEVHTEGIAILTRKMLQSRWVYPKKVTVHYVNDKLYKGFEIEQVSVTEKISHFLGFIKKLKSLLKANKSTVLIVHDVIPLFAAYILLPFLKRRGIKIWYHNHDVTDISKAGKYSLMGIAARSESKIFKSIDCFSLPAKERVIHFPIKKLKSSPVILPNYPLRKFYGQMNSVALPESTLKLVYQGSIGPGHGLEALIKILSVKIETLQLELHLVGKIRSNYKDELEELAKNNKVSSFLIFHGMQPFSNMPQYLSQFDVGLAIHEPYNITYATGGSASNKIYEYAACGLPVILYDNKHYKSYLSDYKWAFFSSLDENKLTAILQQVIKNYEQLRNAALDDFRNELNYEAIFESKLAEIRSNLLGE